MARDPDKTTAAGRSRRLLTDPAQLNFTGDLASIIDKDQEIGDNTGLMLYRLREGIERFFITGIKPVRLFFKPGLPLYSLFRLPCL